MPNIKSAKKRVKVIETKTLRNQMIKSALKTSIKKFDAAVVSGDAEKIKEAYTAAIKKIDQATVKGVLHKNTAARKKSSLTVALNKIS
ncbi:MAG: 30S ribosomal protein S20 [Monoglobales bacterium]